MKKLLKGYNIIFFFAYFSTLSFSLSVWISEDNYTKLFKRDKKHLKRG